MRFSVLSLHPDLFSGFRSEGLLGKSFQSQKLQLNLFNPREFADLPHKRVDDKPYGGGPGMVMKPEPIVRALRSIKEVPKEKKRVVLLAAKGRKFSQAMARRYSKLDHLVLICGRYEGIDERVAENFVDEEIRIGDYVLMGGEVAAQVVIEAVSRLLPEVIGNPVSLEDESFGAGSEKEYAHFTRPPDFEGYKVPEVLLKGNHKEILKWRSASRRKVSS